MTIHLERKANKPPIRLHVPSPARAGHSPPETRHKLNLPVVWGGEWQDTGDPGKETT